MQPILVVIAFLVGAQGFLPTATLRNAACRGSVVQRLSDDSKDDPSSSSSSSTPHALFDSEGWKPIEEDLDHVPVFTVATAEGNPLAYELNVKGKSYTVPCFYCDVDAAVQELESSRQNVQLEGIDLMPFPLGKAFQLWAKDQAIIVPSREAILQAGAPPGTNPIGQQVPMFACMEIAEEGPDGTPRLPLFMALEDANAALQEAVAADGGKMEDFEVVCLSLNRAIEQLAASPESSAFRFLPPSKSMKYIRDYLS